MAIVIVTKNQYLLASKIHHITMTEQREYIDVRTNSGKFRSIKQEVYTICIYYTAEQSQQGLGGSRDETRSCEVALHGKIDAYKVYADLIRQIREQSPDQLFLDKALEDLLNQHSTEIKDMGKENYPFLELDDNDARSKKLRKPRKAKRRSEKVLRKSKARR